MTPHFADWCHAGIGSYDDILVIFFATLLLFLAAPFTLGLFTLWIIQLRNFCSGMTTMERIGSPSHRNRSFSFVERILETADDSVRALDDDGFNGHSSRGLMSTDSYMRFEADGEDDETLRVVSTAEA